MKADCSSREVMRKCIIEISSSKCCPCAAMSFSNWSDILETWSDIFETSALTAPMSFPAELPLSVEFDSKAVTISFRFSSSA